MIQQGKHKMEEKIRVLVVDDHTVVRKGLCALLSAEKYGIEVVGEAADGREAIEKARLLQPQVILLDLAMPGMGGLEAIPAILRGDPQAHILILTSFAEDDQVAAAISSGALGYLRKDASPDELVSTIHTVYLNRMSLPPDLARKMMLHSREPMSKPAHGELTARELDVLRCVAKGYSNKQIATELSVSITTVRTHVSNLLRKLSLENRTQLALYARQNDLGS
jgi:DNA-binding NarL/FixJ family response regulator